MGDAVRTVLTALRVSVYSKTNKNGNIVARHYLPLVQKLTTIFHRPCIMDYFGITEKYDWNEDPQYLKSRRFQKNMAEEYKRLDDKGENYAFNYIVLNLKEFITSLKIKRRKLIQV